MIFDLMSVALLPLAALFALVYGAMWVTWEISLARSVIKTAATGLLALLALTWDLPVWALALGLGAVGDWFLSRDHERGFLPGLAAFLLGHLVYLGLLWPLVDHVSIFVMFVLVGIGLWVIPSHWSALGALRAPVTTYAIISGALGAFAVSLPEGLGLLSLGVLAFILSDVILAEDLFRLPKGHRSKPLYARLLWAFYWCGQALILQGASAAAI